MCSSAEDTPMNSDVSDETCFEKLFSLSESDMTMNYCDCEFIVGSQNVVVKGHKVLFSAASDVFKAMFYGESKEEKPIKMIDLDPEGFQGMKQYIYKGEVNFRSAMHALSIYTAARKYLVSSQLINKCTQYIKENIQPSELLEFYEYCEIYNISGFEELCFKIIQQQTGEVIRNDYFLSARIETIELILKSPSLELISEVEVFCYFEKWALAEADRKKIGVEEMATSFNSLKKHIRFLSMSSEEFVTNVSESILLTPEEKLAISFNLMKFYSKPMPENLSLDYKHRCTFPSSMTPENYEYRYSHTFSFPVDQMSSSDFTFIHYVLPEDNYSECNIKISFFETEGNICFYAEIGLVNNLLEIKSKLVVLAENRSDDLVFVNNNCYIFVESGQNEKNRVIFAVISIFELESERFLRGANKILLIDSFFDVERKWYFNPNMTFLHR